MVAAGVGETLAVGVTQEEVVVAETETKKGEAMAEAEVTKREADEVMVEGESNLAAVMNCSLLRTIFEG